MARKKDKTKNTEEKIFSLRERTKYWIFSIVSFAVSVFFILAAFERAGVVGKGVYKLFFFFFGTGYYLFPIVCFIAGIALVRATKPRMLLATAVGTFFLVFSGLGIISLLGGNGGSVGNAISAPLLALFEIYASLVLLGALFLASLLLSLDATPSFEWIRAFMRLFKREAKDDDFGEAEDSDEENEENEETDNEAEDEEEEGEEDENSGTEKQKETQVTPTLFSSGSSPKKTAQPYSFTSRFSSEKPYVPPPLSLLDGDRGKPGVGDIKANANIIKRTLQNFGIDVEMDEISVGPSVTRYALKPAQGIKLSRIVGLQNDLSLALAAHPIRIEAPIPGKSLVGIEIPNNTRITIGLGSLLAEKDFTDRGKPLLFSLGRSVTGKPFVGNLEKLPHLLIAGTTGSGKSVSIHAVVASLLYRNSPEMLRMILIDPKRVELTLYNNTPHLLTPVITEAKKAILALKWAAKEMDRRYDILETEKVRDIGSYHQTVVEPAYKNFSGPKNDSSREEAAELPEQMPYVVIIIDELADIMSTYPRELEAAIVRLAQMSRAVGIHLILSTQRPSVNIITGLIKANIPARMAFQVASQTDSRTILDMGGAEKLLGAGDMLYLSGEMSKPVRLQSAYISEGEIKRVVAHLEKQMDSLPSEISFSDGAQNETSIFDAVSDDEEIDDDLYEEARDIIVRAGKASTTFLQRKLRVGYARAARLMDILEERGVVGPADGAKQREVLQKQFEEGYGGTPEEEGQPKQ